MMYMVGFSNIYKGWFGKATAGSEAVPGFDLASGEKPDLSLKKSMWEFNAD